MRRIFKEVINSKEELRKIMGPPSELATRKTIDYIDENCRVFIEQSPFMVIGSSDSKGNFDVSPKGDPSGFVKVLDEKTLVIPDRKGNNRADTFLNVFENPNVALIFFIPGIKETLRVSGVAEIVTDQEVLELVSHKGRPPKLAMVVHVQEAFMHCAKCMIRSKLWKNIDLKTVPTLPSLAKSLVEHGSLSQTIKEVDQMLKEDEKNGLY